MAEEMTFESAMNELEEKVKLLETGNLTLDESLAAFESAVALVNKCNEKLVNAERRVQLLVEGTDGSVTDTPFENISNET